MKTTDPHFNAIGAQVKTRLRERKHNSCHCPEHRLYERLQQMSLLCRLFGKKVRINYRDSGLKQTVETTMYLATPKTIILQSGAFISLCDVTDVNIC